MAVWQQSNVVHVTGCTPAPCDLLHRVLAADFLLNEFQGLLSKE